MQILSGVFDVDEVEQRRGMSPLTKALIGVAILIVVIALPVVAFLAGRESNSGDDGGNTTTQVSSEYDFDVLNDMVRILKRDYAKQDNLDDQTLYEAAIQGMLEVLNDSGTYYVDPQTYKVDTSTTLQGGFDGIGATIAEQGGKIVIVRPIKDTPAERAGIVAGDEILSVDGQSTEGWTVEKTVLTIRGPKGSEVKINIRHEDGKEQEYTLKRDRVQVDSVEAIAPGTTLRDANNNVVNGLGYIHISEFTPRTAQEFEAALKDVTSKGATGLILDVRNNLGGSLNAVISSSDLLLDSGTILIQRNADGKETSYVAKQGQLANGLPIVVLQNRFSASASEIIAAAVQENGRGTVIGEKSFGKGTVNTPKELPDGGVMFVTIAQWLTPTGALIDKVGVRPDIEVLPTDDDIDARRDVQLFRAIDVLRGQVKAP
jgi:carboxyl-terminal processing protease